MRTDDLITMLAAGVSAVEPHALRQRFALALGWGAFGGMFLMAILLGVRSDLYEATQLPMFWVKLAFPGALLGGALVAVARLSRPGVPLGRVHAAIAAPVLVMWVIATVALLTAAPGQRDELIFGDTWATCLLNVGILSVPTFAGMLWALKELAPTRLALAGAAAGLLSGATGASIYALHCPEMAAPFLGIWYLLAMLIPAAVGAAIGPRILRW